MTPEGVDILYDYVFNSAICLHMGMTQSHMPGQQLLRFVHDMMILHTCVSQIFA